jgi:hypothetical protein
MKAIRIVSLLAICAASFARAAQTPESPIPVPFTSVKFTDTFWGPKITLNHDRVLPHNIHQCEITGRIANFAKAGGLMEGKHEGYYFNDSDVYKMIEGAAYTLAHQRDAALEKTIDDIIDKIAAAQRPDGYIYTYYTLRNEMNKRWSDLPAMHELYCGGHLIEAGVAYHQATGKRKLLDVGIRFADLICSVFGPDKRRDVCGHQEIELALFKLWRHTGEVKYRDLAAFFINERGHANGRKLQGDYSMDNLPLPQQREIVGHAVRAMYYFSGAADVASINHDQELITTLDRLWHDVVDRKMYITGGIGPSAHNEGFTVPYDLPNDSAYAETCAAIGMVFWNHRMTILAADAKYADVMERAMYNGALAGVSLDGVKYNYTNPLGSRGKHRRQDWFGCACCPPNIARFLPSIGNYLYATGNNSLYVNLYAASESTVSINDNKIKLTQQTLYPWDGQVKLNIDPDKDAAFALKLRIPNWCKGASVRLNGQPVELQTQKGYATLDRPWKKGDVVELDLPMPVQRVKADPNVKANIGRVALQRGPIVYCLEGIDNSGSVRNLSLPPTSDLVSQYQKDLLGGVVVIKGAALPRLAEGVGQPVEFVAVPYYAWNNREPGQMVLWLPENPELAEPKLKPTMASESKTSASQVWHLDTIEALNDQLEPANSHDTNIPRLTWWDHKGTAEWVQYDFKSAKKVSAVEVYFFDDTGAGGCRLPQSWQILYKAGDSWKPVSASTAYPLKPDTYNKLSFTPIETTALRLQVQLQPNFSAGILEWRVTE